MTDPDTRDTDAFQTIRWKLDAWMEGWLKAQKEARYGMNSERQENK